jgi:hypothetical protein
MQNQGYFCDGTCWNAIPEVLAQKATNRNGVLEPFVPVISIANTPSCQQNFVSLCVLEPFFFIRKSTV